MTTFAVRTVNGELTPPASAAGPDLGVDPLAGVEFATLFTPCNRSARLTAAVLRQGVVSQGGATPMGLVFPTITLAPAGQLLLTFSYSGQGNTTSGMPANLGKWFVVLASTTES